MGSKFLFLHENSISTNISWLDTDLPSFLGEIVRCFEPPDPQIMNSLVFPLSLSSPPSLVLSLLSLLSRPGVITRAISDDDKRGNINYDTLSTQLPDDETFRA